MDLSCKGRPRGVACLAAGLLALTLGCTILDNTGGAPPSAGFGLTAAPASLEVPAGGSGYVTVTASRQGSFAGAIDLGVEGLPSGVAASGTIPAGQASGFLTVAVAPGVAARSLGTLTLVGTAGTLRKTAALALGVLPALAPTTLASDRVQAGGGTATAGGLANTALVQEPAAAVIARDPSGVVELRHGFLPESQPSQP